MRLSERAVAAQVQIKMLNRLKRPIPKELEDLAKEEEPEGADSPAVQHRGDSQWLSDIYLG
jgi:hypothetical protein